MYRERERERDIIHILYVCMYIYIYIYTYVCIYIYIYVLHIIEKTERGSAWASVLFGDAQPSGLLVLVLVLRVLVLLI